MNDDERRSRLWSIQDLAVYLGVPVETIYKWNHNGSGPPRLTIGRYVRYREADVLEWVESRRQG